MPKHSALTDEALELVARRFAVLGEPMRLRLIQALFEGERNVGELVAATGGTQANVSRHLQTLIAAHVLRRRKEGVQVYYEIADPNIFKLCELVCGSLEKSLSKQAARFSAAP
ncbi:MAG TPA: metalloregulator ArsR/SmtB family transcription factor [Candidatus Didemnitutus sp.]|nr:metalloregulator ArsR/SmtB family transcription factor [Candidatus Didemnitutus sp.]